MEGSLNFRNGVLHSGSGTLELRGSCSAKGAQSCKNGPSLDSLIGSPSLLKWGVIFTLFFSKVNLGPSQKIVA